MTAVLHSRVAPVLELGQRSGSDPEEAGVLSLPPRCSTGVSCGTLTSHLLSTWRREQAAPFGTGAGPGGNGMSRRERDVQALATGARLSQSGPWKRQWRPERCS